MQKILIILLLVALGFAWKPSILAFYAKMQHKITNEQADVSNQDESYKTDEMSNRGNYVCDGRIYCSQMASCEEATFFLEHCPGVKMDGNHDGVPCEKQWCG
jgi:hypothetical protein